MSTYFYIILVNYSEYYKLESFIHLKKNYSQSINVIYIYIYEYYTLYTQLYKYFSVYL